MRRTYLEEFEEAVLLLVAILQGEAYAVAVSKKLEQQTGRQVTLGTIHNTLIRLEDKGFVSSGLAGATQERGGRRKRLFTITATGWLFRSAGQLETQDGHRQLSQEEKAGLWARIQQTCRH